MVMDMRELFEAGNGKTVSHTLRDVRLSFPCPATLPGNVHHVTYNEKNLHLHIMRLYRAVSYVIK